jgi:cobalt-zinc-cadmium efflux system outer membrane protein
MPAVVAALELLLTSGVRFLRASAHGRQRRLTAALPVAIAITFSGAARAEVPAGAEELPRSLSLADAENLFLTRGLDLLIAEYGAEGAEGDVRAAGAHPNPGLDVGVAYTPPLHRDVIYSGISPNVPNSLWGLSIGVTDNAAISDQLSGKRSLRIEAASKALAAARLNVDEVKRQGLGQLRLAYVAAVMANLDLVDIKDSFQTYDEQLKLNQKRYDEGALGGLDLSRATQAQTEAMQSIDQAESGRKQALASLLFLLGVRGGGLEVALTTTFEYAPLAKLKEATLPWLVQQARANRADAKIAAANLEQAQVLLRQARRARVPDIALSLGYAEQCGSGSCSSQPAFSAGLQSNLPLFYQQQGEIRRAESNIKAAQRSLDKVDAQVLLDVTGAFAAYTAAKSQVERMESKLLQQARVSRDLAQHLYQRGAASFIDFMDAQRAFVSSRLEYHQDLANYWGAVYQLEQATATPLR